MARHCAGDTVTFTFGLRHKPHIMHPLPVQLAVLAYNTCDSAQLLAFRTSAVLLLTQSEWGRPVNNIINDRYHFTLIVTTFTFFSILRKVPIKGMIAHRLSNLIHGVNICGIYQYMLGIAVRDGALNVTVPRDSADTLCRPVTKLWRGVVFTLRPGHWRWINSEWPLQIKVLAINPTIIVVLTHSLCKWSVIQNESLSNKFSTFKYVLCIPYYFLLHTGKMVNYLIGWTYLVSRRATVKSLAFMYSHFIIIFVDINTLQI